MIHDLFVFLHVCKKCGGEFLHYLFALIDLHPRTCCRFFLQGERVKFAASYIGRGIFSIWNICCKLNPEHWIP